MSLGGEAASPSCAGTPDLRKRVSAQAVGRLTDAEHLAREARTILPPEQRPQTEPLFIAQLMLISIDRGSEPPEIDVARGFTIGGHAIAAAMVGRYDLEMGDWTRASPSFEAIGRA